MNFKKLIFLTKLLILGFKIISRMKKLSRNLTVNLIGGASEARCSRMRERWERRGYDHGSRLYARLVKNCGSQDIFN